MRWGIVAALVGLVAGALLFSKRAAASVGPSDETPETSSIVQDVLVAVSGLGSRGIRNNNPGNIRRSDTRWKGERAEVTDTVFEEFETPEDGIRAMAIILQTYRTRYNLRTIGEIVNRYAPPIENDTDAYAATVSRRTGIPITQDITDADLPAIIAAMIYVENGAQPYDIATIERGVQAA